MVAPKDALTVRLSEISCQVDLSTVTVQQKDCDEDARGSDQLLDEETGAALPRSCKGLYDSLDSDDKRALDKFLSCFKGDKIKRHEEPRRKRVKTKHHRPVEDISAFNKLTEAVMDVLVQGGKRTYPGFKLLEGTSWPGLLHVAPGVFHMDYLKVPGRCLLRPVCLLTRDLVPLDDSGTRQPWVYYFYISLPDATI
jgi:hypothetical protein